MAVLLIDNSFNLRINLGLIGELTGIDDCHCFTDYSSSLKFLEKNLDKIKVVFINPNLDDAFFIVLMDILKKCVAEGKMKVRVLYKASSFKESYKANEIQFTGMPITRNEIDLLRTL